MRLPTKYRQTDEADSFELIAAEGGTCRMSHRTSSLTPLGPAATMQNRTGMGVGRAV